MAVFWISFHIDDGTHGGRTYRQRYDALVDALARHVSGTPWEETTSFVLMSSPSSRLQIASSIGKAISTANDTVIVGSMDHKGLTLVGSAKEFSNLQKLVPELDLGA